ncbi:hypothetical protein [Halomonas llamarensis]|nr:hypothetical protein [Halomonas llamarensis]
MLALLPLLMCLRGRVNFRHLSRYSDYHEKTFLSLLTLSEETANTLIAAMDCRFIPKSGRHTEELGKFYSGGTGRAEKGLHFHFNASMTALNLLERFSSYLGRDFNCIKSRPDFEQMCRYGAVAS